MTKQLIITIYSFLFSILLLPAQQDLSTHFMRETWQSNFTNPAFFPSHNVVIGLPGLYNNLLITGITYNDLVSMDENGKRVLDMNQAISQLEADNLVQDNLSIETLSVGLTFGKFLVSLNHGLRTNAFLDHPKTLSQLIWQGNAQFIGQEVQFGPDLQVFTYNEFGLGLGYQVTPNLSIGGRAKFLGGVADISTERHDLRLFTDEDIYQLTLEADLLVNTTGEISYDGFDEITFENDFLSFSEDGLFSQNNGFAFDLGAHLKLGKLELAASVLDIGKINWKDDNRNYSLQGTFEYTGLDIAQDILSDTIEVGSILDTLQEQYDVIEFSNNYSTTLPSRYYLSATYQLNERWRFGGLVYGETFRGETEPAVAVSANAQLLPFLNVGALYAFRNETFDNLGLNFSVKLGPVQLMAATDNILTAFDIENSNSANVRVGLNVLLFSKGENRGSKRDVNNIENQDTFFN